MKNYKQIEMVVAVVLLSLSAIGALLLSGIATYQFFLPLGWMTSVAAVMAIELGIPGAIFAIRTKRDISRTGGVGWIITTVSIVLALLVAMGANILYKIDILDIEINPRFINFLRILTTTFIIPLLAVFAIERLRIAILTLLRTDGKIEDRVVDENTPDDRMSYYVKHYGSPDDVPVAEMAVRFGRSAATIKRDLEKWIRRGEF